MQIQQTQEHQASARAATAARRPGISKNAAGYWAMTVDDSYGPFDTFDKAQMKLRELALAKWRKIAAR